MVGERFECNAAKIFDGWAVGVGWCRRAHLVTSTPGPEHPSKTHPCEDIRGLQVNSNTNSQPVRGGAMWERTERENQTVQDCS